MPHKKLIVQYSDGQFQFKVPFIMYADFESILEPIQGPGNDPMISSMRGINNHVPSGWCVHSKFTYGKVENPLKLYRGKDCFKEVLRSCNWRSSSRLSIISRGSYETFNSQGNG